MMPSPVIATKMKICGVTTAPEVDMLSAHGITFCGLQVDVSSPWSIDASHARQLALLARGGMRPTLVTGAYRPQVVMNLIDQVGATAVQLGALSLPEHVRRVREAYPREALTIIQEIPYKDGRFSNEGLIPSYLEAGADFILLDKHRSLDRSSDGLSIPIEQLRAFRVRHPSTPLLVAGAVNTENVDSLLLASGASGIDACGSVRENGSISGELVERLKRAVSQSIEPKRPPSLRDFLNRLTSGNHVIAYLTLGDPPVRFLEVARQALRGGALTLELGFPHPQPKEGEVLAKSHQRALAAGITQNVALRLFHALACEYADIPLIAVLQWPPLPDEESTNRLLDDLAKSGAAAVLPVGLPLWQLPALSEHVHSRGMEMVVPCPSDTSIKYRSIVLRYCSGCLYVPRARMTGSTRHASNVDHFCQSISQETDLPIVVGVGIKTARDVQESCRPPVKAAAVGSALVEHLTSGGSAAEFIRALIPATQ